MTAPLDLYYFPASPPCIAAIMVANAVGVNVNKKLINIMAGEQLQPDFLKINPQHTIPTINDNGLVLWESRAILKYLVDAYAKDDTLAPKEAKAAALVNQRLYFDATTLFSRVVDYFKPVLFMGQQPDSENAAKIEEALGWMNDFLQNEVWVAGQFMTIADFSLVVSVSVAEACMIDLSNYPNISEWLKRCERSMSDYGFQDVLQVGIEMIAKTFKSKVDGD